MRIVCISDTHGQDVPLHNFEGDLLIVAGDWSRVGRVDELHKFCKQLREWKETFEQIVVISGNHDFISEEDPPLTKFEIEHAGAVYLNDSGCMINQMLIWGSAVLPRFGDWAWNRDRGQDIKKHWDMIPEYTDILITHGPPKFIFDRVENSMSSNYQEHVGCDDLLMAVEKSKIKLHVFGHIHSGNGIALKDGRLFVNASVLDENYNQTNKPRVVDIL